MVYSILLLIVSILFSCAFLLFGDMDLFAADSNNATYDVFKWWKEKYQQLEEERDALLERDRQQRQRDSYHQKQVIQFQQEKKQMQDLLDLGPVSAKCPECEGLKLWQKNTQAKVERELAEMQHKLDEMTSRLLWQKELLESHLKVQL